MDIHSYFNDVYQREPTVITQAPGRVELLGNYAAFNDGLALSCALDQNIRIALAPSRDSRSTFFSTHFPKQAVVEEFEPQTEQAWVNYPLGVCAMLTQAGFEIQPFVALINGNIPPGVGLSSSAALEVAMGLALREHFHINIDDVALAMLCAKAETDFVGARCSTMNQLACFYTKPGHVLLSDFRRQQHRNIPLPQRDFLLAVTLSGISQAYADDHCIQRRDECTIAAEYFSSLDSSKDSLRDISMHLLQEHKNKFDTTAYRRAKHIIGENHRVLQAVDLLQKEDVRGLGILMYASHSSSQGNFENSCPELDMLVEIAQGINGIYGSKLTGKGFGGATVSLMKKGAEKHYNQSITHTYPQRAGREATVIYTKMKKR